MNKQNIVAIDNHSQYGGDMIRAEKIFKDFLVTRGLRYTQARRKILKEVFSLQNHFEADDIVQKLRSKGEKVSIASVYRTIPLLIDAGIIIKNPCEHMNARLEPVFGQQHHDHLICVKCKKIIEFRDNKIEQRQKKVAQQHGFEMEEHRLVIRGYCGDCQQLNENKSEQP
ncbi:MAG: transcriptional repressor [Proteobacteria bacterium]|nr:transcriptional repressor [Pseudomonadota bacterium]